MKTKTWLDQDNWLHIELEAETPKECSELVRFGLSANAESKRACSVYTTADSVKAFVSLRAMKEFWLSRMGPNAFLSITQ